jgi:predicted alpha/beta superfamily hydrolase
MKNQRKLKMKKILTIITIMLLIAILGNCSNTDEDGNSGGSGDGNSGGNSVINSDGNSGSKVTALSVNTMTQTEKEKASIGNLTILDREPSTTATYDDFISINAKNADELKSELDKINFKDYFESENPFPEFDTYDAWIDSFSDSFDGNTNVGIGLPNPNPQNPTPKDANGLPITNANFDWEFDRTEIESIKDSTREISIHDEEMGMTFVVMLTLPPNFDESKAYPALVMTDGVWSFGSEHFALHKLMENGEAQDTMLISIGYDYSVNGADDSVRYGFFIEQQEEFLNFITDNLMPYIAENYKIDFSNSTFYGSSLGGVFSHYALFNSDKYENNPFGKYIIASPVLWRYGDDAYADDFGYFDRNKELDKEVYIAVGSNEDDEFVSTYGSDIFGGKDSTITGAESLHERLKSHNADVTYEVFEGKGHGEYLEEMFSRVISD